MSKWQAGELEIQHIPQIGWGLFEEGEVVAVRSTLAELVDYLNKKEEE